MSKKEQITERVLETIAEQLGIARGDVKLADDLERDLGADSLDKIEMVMALEEEFETEAPDEEIEKLVTVQQVIDYTILRLAA